MRMDRLIKQQDLLERRHKEQPSVEWQQRLDKIKSDKALKDAH